MMEKLQTSCERMVSGVNGRSEGSFPPKCGDLCTARTFRREAFEVGKRKYAKATIVTKVFKAYKP